jgi:Family of unknown function (DUF6452)
MLTVQKYDDLTTTEKQLFPQQVGYICDCCMARVLLFFLTIFLISCFEQGDCSDVSGFFRSSDKRALARELDSVKLVGWDSVMYAGDSLSVINLPVNTAVTQSSYILYYKESQVDTLNIEYNLQTFALAPACNAIDLITLKKATTMTLPDAVITQPKITNRVVENIKLYF